MIDFNYFLGNLLYAYLPFLAQLVLAESIFCVGLNRKPLFVIRLLVSVIFLVAGSFFIVFFATLTSVFILSDSLSYLSIFLLSVVLMKLCFNSSWIYLLFRSVSGYATQNMAYVVWSAAWAGMWSCGLLPKLASVVNIWNYTTVVNMIFCLLVDFLVYLVFARRLKNFSTESLYSGQVLALSLVSLAVVVFFCKLAETYVYWITPFYISCMFFCALFCVFVLLLQSGMLKSSRFRHEIAVINGLLEKEKLQYELTKESIQTINIKCHDLRHCLRALRDGNGMSECELKNIENAIAIYDSNMNTGNETLDIVLTEKKMYCESRGITFMCMADADELSFMSNTDIYSLFGNILENAAIAVSGITDESRKFINFSIKKGAGMLFICCENCYDGTLTFENGLPQTTNPDVKNHGYGVKSIKLLVTKYGGDMYITAENGVFTINIALPYLNKKSKL